MFYNIYSMTKNETLYAKLERYNVLKKLLDKKNTRWMELSRKKG
jgi:hypothetical protein